MKMLANILKLFCSPYSPPTRGALLVIKALNLKVEYKNINILSRRYLNSDLLVINPQHTIPTLQDGNFVLWDSHAIAGYLVSMYGNDDSLYPKNPKKRAIVDQRLHFDTEHLFPKVIEVVQPLLSRHATDVSAALQRKINRSYGLLDAFLSNSTWLAGENMTIADLCCVSSISTLDLLVPVAVDKFPNLGKFLANCNKLPYYYEANQAGLDMLCDKIQERMISTYVNKLYYADRI